MIQSPQDDDVTLNFLKEIAQYVCKNLVTAGFRILDKSNSDRESDQISDECDTIGIPFCIELNADTLSRGLVQLRNRDTTLKEPLPITQLQHRLYSYVNTV